MKYLKYFESFAFKNGVYFFTDYNIEINYDYSASKKTLFNTIIEFIRKPYNKEEYDKDIKLCLKEKSFLLDKYLDEHLSKEEFIKHDDNIKNKMKILKDKFKKNINIEETFFIAYNNIEHTHYKDMDNAKEYVSNNLESINKDIMQCIDIELKNSTGQKKEGLIELKNNI